MLQMRQQLIDRGILTRTDDGVPQMHFNEAGSKEQPN